MKLHRHTSRHAWLVASISACFLLGAQPGVVAAQSAPAGQGESNAGSGASDADKGDAGATDKRAKKRRGGPNREGEYGGVVPGQVPDQDSKRRKVRKRKNAVSWIGFQPRPDGTSRLFLRMANELTYEQSVQGEQLVVNIAGARYRHRNTRRRLDVRFFATPLSLVLSKRVSSRRARKDRPARKAGIELRISFKDKEDVREASASMSTEPDGYTYLYLEFPAPASKGTISVSDPEG